MLKVVNKYLKKTLMFYIFVGINFWTNVSLVK